MKTEMHEFIETLKRDAVPAKAAALADLRNQIKNPKNKDCFVTESVSMRVLVGRPRGFYNAIKFTDIDRANWEHQLRVIDLEIVETIKKELDASWDVYVSGAQIWGSKIK